MSQPSKLKGGVLVANLPPPLGALGLLFRRDKFSNNFTKQTAQPIFFNPSASWSNAGSSFAT